MVERAVAQPCSGAALRAVPHVPRCCLSSSYLLPAHFANAALTGFFFPSLPPSLLLFPFPAEMFTQCSPFSPSSVLSHLHACCTLCPTCGLSCGAAPCPLPAPSPLASGLVLGNKELHRLGGCWGVGAAREPQPCRLPSGQWGHCPLVFGDSSSLGGELEGGCCAGKAAAAMVTSCRGSLAVGGFLPSGAYG